MVPARRSIPIWWSSVLELGGTLNIAALRRAFDALLTRHAALRVSFVQTRGGQPLQVVHRQCRIPWLEQDLSGLSRAECEAQARVIAADDRRVGFAISHAPLMRAKLLKLDGGDRLLLTQHHLLGDGWSGAVLLTELAALYRSQGDRALARPPGFADYLAWRQRQDRQAATDAWRTYLQGLDAPTKLAGKATLQGVSATELIGDSSRPP